MSSISATVVQKALKTEATTIYAVIDLNAAGTTADLVTADGASKGFLDVDYVATGKYVLTLQPGIAVNQFLGAPSVIIKNDNVTDRSYGFRVLESTSGAAASITIMSYRADTGAADPVVSTGGVAQILVTVPFTTSNTF